MGQGTQTGAPSPAPSSGGNFVGGANGFLGGVVNGFASPGQGGGLLGGGAFGGQHNPFSGPSSTPAPGVQQTGQQSWAVPIGSQQSYPWTQMQMQQPQGYYVPPPQQQQPAQQQPAQQQTAQQPAQPQPDTSNPWAIQSGDNFDFHHHYNPGDTATFHGQTYVAQGDPNIWNENSPPPITSNLWRLQQQQTQQAPAQPQPPQPNAPRATFAGAAPQAWQMTGLKRGGIVALMRGRK